MRRARALRRRYGRSANAARFHVVVVNDRTGKVTYMTSSPVTHREGCTILSKFDVRRPWLRKKLLPVGSRS